MGIRYADRGARCPVEPTVGRLPFGDCKAADQRSALPHLDAAPISVRRDVGRHRPAFRMRIAVSGRADRWSAALRRLHGSRPTVGSTASGRIPIPVGRDVGRCGPIPYADRRARCPVEPTVGRLPLRRLHGRRPTVGSTASGRTPIFVGRDVGRHGPHSVCGSRRTVSGRADRWSAALRRLHGSRPTVGSTASGRIPIPVGRDVGRCGPIPYADRRARCPGRADRWSAAPAAIARQPTNGRLYRIWTHPDSRRPRRWSVRSHSVCGSSRAMSR